MSGFIDDPQFISELKLAPPTEPIMLAGWRGCVSWASRNTVCIVAFRNDTGAKSVDSSDRATMLAFTDWVTLNVWGDENGQP